MSDNQLSIAESISVGTKLYYNIGEVAKMFGVNNSLIRYWENEFDVLKPKKNKKGNRLFTADDVENIKLIYHLVKEQGLTLEGAKKYLKQNKKALKHELKADKSHTAEIEKKLKKIKSELLNIQSSL